MYILVRGRYLQSEGKGFPLLPQGRFLIYYMPHRSLVRSLLTLNERFGLENRYYNDIVSTHPSVALSDNGDDEEVDELAEGMIEAAQVRMWRERIKSDADTNQ